jgi:hypothetical protein
MKNEVYLETEKIYLITQCGNLGMHWAYAKFQCGKDNLQRGEN